MDFTAFDLRIGTITAAEHRGDALHVVLDVGGAERRATTRITENYGAEDLLGRQVLAVTNPGDRSDGEVVILAAVSPSQGAVLLQPDRPVANGTQVV